MSKKYEMPFSDEAKKLLQKAESVAGDKGVFFRGDDRSGAFSGRGVKGEYVVENNKIYLTIHKKPMYIPWSAVELKLKQFFQ